MDDDQNVKDSIHVVNKFIGQTNNVLCFLSSLNSELKYRLFGLK